MHSKVLDVIDMEHFTQGPALMPLVDPEGLPSFQMQRGDVRWEDRHECTLHRVYIILGDGLSDDNVTKGFRPYCPRIDRAVDPQVSIAESPAGFTRHEHGVHDTNQQQPAGNGDETTECPPDDGTSPPPSPRSIWSLGNGRAILFRCPDSPFYAREDRSQPLTNRVQVFWAHPGISDIRKSCLRLRQRPLS